MAFDQNNFSPVSASASPAPKLFSYSSSTDTLTTILATGYFADKQNQLEEGDYIFVVGSDGSAGVQVLSDTSSAAVSFAQTVDFYISWSSKVIVPKSQTTSPDANLANNTRVVHAFSGISLPSGDTLDNYTIQVVAVELFVNSIWSTCEFIHTPNLIGAGGFLTNDSVVVQTASNFVIVPSSACGGGHGYNGANLTSAPARIRIVAIKK